jgi:hypothetical protein
MVTFLVISFSNANAVGSDLSPNGTKSEKKVWEYNEDWWDTILPRLAGWGLKAFKEPVHEEMTHRAYGCSHLGIGMCDDPDADYASWQVIAGVRWNDDPPFQISRNVPTRCKAVSSTGQRNSIRFISQPYCWGDMFLKAKEALKKDPATRFDSSTESPLPLRSHLGDLQFLHAMASEEGESSAATREKILAWAEFAWDVTMSKHGNATLLREITQPSLMKQNFGRSGWRVQDLFALGDPALQKHVPDVAFGSLLHMVQDSFSASHVDRKRPAYGKTCVAVPNEAEPGPIEQFNSYRTQSSDSHAKADTRAAFVGNPFSPDAVAVSKVLIRLRSEHKSWLEVEPYLKCVFDISASN